MFMAFPLFAFSIVDGLSSLLLLFFPSSVVHCPSSPFLLSFRLFVFNVQRFNAFFRATFNVLTRYRQV